MNAVEADSGSHDVGTGDSPVFHDIVAEAAGFPPAALPMLPLLGRCLASPWTRPAPRSCFDRPDTAWTHNGRSALAWALRLAGVEGGGTVLMPAYHCGSIIEPAAWLGARVALYRVGRALEIDVDDVRRHLRTGVRAVVAVHYFGVPQALDELAAACREHDAALIEDCSHAFFGEAGGRLLGTTGDFAFTSTVKFFPGVDGGALIAADGRRLEPLHRALRTPRPAAEARAWLHAVQEAAAFGGLGPLGAAWRAMESARAALRAPQAAVATPPTPPTPPRFRWFVPDRVDAAMTAASRWMARATNRRAALAARREHYLRLHARLAGARGARPLHESLPETVVPYVLPLLLDDPERQFRALKQRRVPLWRWEELMAGDCETSTDYRLRLVQLPCHQWLRAADVEWLADTVLEALAAC